MKKKEKINIRGAIKALEVGGEPLILPMSEYKPSTIRSTAGSITTDTGKKYKVEMMPEFVRVTRKC